MDMSASVRKRPISVWIVSAFFFISSLWGMWSYYLIAVGKTSPEYLNHPYFANLTILDYAFIVLLQLVALCAAITLFLLRKAAFYLFVTGMAISIIFTAIKAIRGIYQNANPVAVGVAMAMTYAIHIAVCLYSWKLLKKGILT